jgi:Putative serine esterase (DUF676)
LVQIFSVQTARRSSERSKHYRYEADCRRVPKLRPQTKWPLALPLMLGAALVSSCSFLGVKQEVKELSVHGLITVQVTPVVESAPTYALAWTEVASGTNEMIGFQPVGTNGLAVFLLRQDRSYNLGAFTDLNHNGAYDGGEPVAYVKNVRPASLVDDGPQSKPVPLHLSPTNGLPPGQSAALPRENPDLGDALPVVLGEIANLDDTKFSAEVGEMGMWKPYNFIIQYGFGIYFLEPYDRHKLPVLFINGISGSPQDWRPVMEKLDRKKYQVWFVYYPSGIRLDKTANGLATALLLLKQRHGFDRMAVVAHSMGGLVSRGAIQRAVKQAGTNFIPEFFTASTPWDGQASATLAVEHLDYPVPSWRDMAPGSAYLREIMSHPLPPGTRHDLMFSYQSSGGLGLPADNDSVVGVASELFIPVQEQAATVFGLHLDHMKILKSPITLRRIEMFLPLAPETK